MARKKKNTDMGPVKMDLTPLIDCVFLLIVFFIVAGKFKKVESKLNAFLPKDIGIDNVAKPDPDKFFINVLCLGDRDKIEWRVNDALIESRSELVKKLVEISKGVVDSKKIKVAIDGLSEINFYWVIAALDACAEAQLYEIMFAPPRVDLDKWPRPLPKNLNLGQ